MKDKWFVAAVAGLCAVLLPAVCLPGCTASADGGKTGEASQASVPPLVNTAGLSAVTESAAEGSMDALFHSLEEMAELERGGSRLRGIGIAESSLREQTGDYAGAVAAAYKELAWDYGLGLITKEAVEQGLRNVLSMSEARQPAVQTADGLLAFVQGQWDTAEKNLLPFGKIADEEDSFFRWLSLSCALEKNREDRGAASAYRAIRARYLQFPEYWYRGARVFSGVIAAQYAEHCISLAPSGPFSAECRQILAVFAGISPEDAPSLRTKLEIETAITAAAAAGNPALLEPLLPVIGLPENPYTVYATGALRALAQLPQFREYFSGLAAVSKGRRAERLAYLCRG